MAVDRFVPGASAVRPVRNGHFVQEKSTGSLEKRACNGNRFYSIKVSVAGDTRKVIVLLTPLTTGQL